ncbi:sensor transduction histidine kinase [Octadecabacter antarcticus 307]|uniref:histidine kinase n=1 Tax=Octadecabacter antarcticus 307 TaxID=391626 RepID=M9R8F4_9RHOB|nr:ATP-binding protein [Octadecabacter antarcticus]AGI68073.1 sensor transduction histidine kinase [Octadecabacter antarcticus 307]
MSDIRALILALPHPVILIDSAERISATNAPAKHLIGMACDGLPYITALRQPALIDAVEATLKDATLRVVRYLGNDGARDTTWTVTVTAATLTDGSTVVLSFQDMTAVEDANDMRRDFVANVSHELRTPLTSLLGFIETLRGPARDDSAAQTRFLGIMEQEARRMHSLVQDLMSLNRVEGQERIKPTQQTDLCALMDDVLAAMKPRADTAGVSLMSDHPNEAVYVLADRDQMWQVIANLVENALKYGKKSGSNDGIVTVRLSAPQHEPALLQSGVRLSVIDHGDGIAAHHLARLTQRFYRVDSHRNREVGGTGLGLAIVKHIINRHRGRLRISSVVGQGTEFTAVLPVFLDRQTD